MTGDRRYEIDDVAFVGRTLDEYRRTFDLDVEALSGRRVLDCPGGACSFVRESRDRGVRAVGADVRDDRTPAALSRTATLAVDRAMDALDGVEELYRWAFYDGVAELSSYRHRAASRFLRDYATNGERYAHASLPTLPYPTGEFDLVLSAHFLFLYDDRLSTAFHLEAIRELSRVGGEIRVFPLSGFDAERSDLVEPVGETLRAAGRAVETRPVPFEFQRGATEMLVVG
jgi:hypothetical protein